MNGRQIPKWFLDLLGLPRNTVGFVLRASFNQETTVECTYYPDLSRPDQVVNERFRLVPDKSYVAMVSESISSSPSPMAPLEPIPHLTTICLSCKKPFTPKNPFSKFCSMRCYDQFHEEDDED